MKRAYLGLILTALCATPVAAQYAGSPPRPLRDGFWIGFGWGAGRISFGADASAADPVTSLSGHLRLGGTISPNWLLGAETNGWTGDVNGASAQFGTLMGTATFYPEPAGNFFLKGGLGFGRYHEDLGSDNGEATGGALQLGLGYDFRFKGNFGLSVVGNYITTSGWEYKFDGTPVGANVDPRLFQVGLGLIWH